MPRPTTKLSSTARDDVIRLKSLCGAMNGSDGAECTLLQGLVNYAFLKALADKRIDEFNKAIVAVPRNRFLSDNAYAAALHAKMPLARTFAHGSADMVAFDQVHYGRERYRKGNNDVLRIPGDVDLMAVGSTDVDPIDTFCDAFAERYGKAHMIYLGAGVNDEVYGGKISSHTRAAAMGLHTVGAVLDITPQMFEQLLRDGAAYFGQPELTQKLKAWIGADGKFRPEVVDSINASYKKSIGTNAGLATSTLAKSGCTRDHLRTLLWVDCKMGEPEPLLSPPAMDSIPCIRDDKTRAVVPVLTNHENPFADLAHKFIQAATSKGPPEKTAQAILDFGLRYMALRNAYHGVEIYRGHVIDERLFRNFTAFLTHLMMPTYDVFHEKPLNQLFPPQNLDTLRQAGPTLQAQCSHKYYVRPERTDETLAQIYDKALDIYWDLSATLHNRATMRDNIQRYFQSAKDGTPGRDMVADLITPPLLETAMGAEIFPYVPEYTIFNNAPALADEVDYCTQRLSGAIDHAKRLAGVKSNLDSARGK